MPWTTPSLRDVRSMVRDMVRATLPGADANIPNSLLRVMSDAQGALTHETLQYIDWLANQLLPDTAETEWLDRHGQIWLVNSDGSVGRKLATLADGSVTFTGVTSVIIPAFTQLTYGGTVASYETLEQITLGAAPTAAATRALNPGTLWNIASGTTLGVVTTQIGIDTTATVVTMDGGTDDETDDELRGRILLRIREPPMGGDAKDYVQWALAVPGVTRAWCFPQEMGIGTCTLRFMMDDLRAANGGFPLPDDVDTVAAYIDTVRPVTVKDMFVESPIPYPIDLRIQWLNSDVETVRGAITDSLLTEFFNRSMPGQTWYRAWSDEGIINAPGVIAYDLVASDVLMPSAGYMATLGDVRYG